METNHHIDRTYKACCPICGKTLFNANPEARVDGHCPKCSHYYRFVFHADGYTVSTQSSNFKLADGQQP